MKHFLRNLELYAAVYTFLGQYKLYQAILLETAPHTPEIKAKELAYRIEGNRDYCVAFLCAVILIYFTNVNELLLEEAAIAGQEVTTQTATNTTPDLTSVLQSNKASIVGDENKVITTVRIIRQGKGRRYEKIRTASIIKNR